MNELILYIIKSTLYTSVFQSFYLLLMRKTTFFRLNRIVFIAGTFLCLVLPFIKIHIPVESTVITPITFIEEAIATRPLTLPAAVVGTEAPVNWFRLIISLIYMCGAISAFIVTAVSYLRMCLMIRSVKPTMIDGQPVKIVDEDIPSFSWGKHIVIGRKDLEENPAILTHERMHVRCGHSFDLIAYTIVITLQWFNPLVWISRTELKMLHEYEADELTINKGIDATQYQLLLVKKAVGAKRFQLANGFNHSKLKNRITMMHKNKTNRMMKLVYFLCIPAIIGTMWCCAQNSKAENTAVSRLNVTMTDQTADIDTTRNAAVQAEDKESVPFQQVETKPTFNGSDANAFSLWVNQNLQYPAACKEAGQEGRVTIQFTVSSTGKVKDVKVLRGVCEELDKEAVRVVSSSPDWTPGYHEGKAVAVTYTFPIIFQTKKQEKTDVVPFQYAEIKPGFNGGDVNEFSKWVNEQLVYPENCKKEGISGRVTLTFTVSETGKVTDVKVLRGVHKDLDNEAIRVVSSSPDWTPGISDGKPVAIKYTFPVIFKTRKTE